MAGTASAAAPTPDGSFNGSATPAGSFDNTKLAVDEASGDVYVIDRANDAVNRFDAAGNYVSQLTGSQAGDGTFQFGGEDDIAVDNSGGPRQGYVYVSSEGKSFNRRRSISAFDASGRLLWESSIPGDDNCGVGVDARGMPWAADYNSQAVSQLDPATGAMTGTAVNVAGQGVNPCQIDFDASDNLYVAAWHGTLEKYDSAGAYVRQVAAGMTYDVAVDRRSGDVYGVQETVSGFQVGVWDSTGAVVSGTPFATASPNLSGVTVDGVDGRIYVSDASAREIDIWLAGGAPPADRELTVTAAGTGNGSVSDDRSGIANCTRSGGVCRFDFADGTTVTLTATAAANSTFIGWSGGGCSGTGTCVVTLTADEAVTATFSQARPSAVTGAASAITSTTATLAGTANPNGASTTCQFQYGPTTSYGSTAPCASAPGSGTAPVAVQAALRGLTANATYNYRLVTTNSGGTTNGANQTFRTAAAAPTATTGAASGVTVSAATLGATVNPNGTATTCTIEYGTTTAYGTSVPCNPAPGAGSAPVAVSAAVSGLAANTTYHFRVVARNDGGTTNGANASFTTAAHTCATDAALCPPRPPPSCATDPSICPVAGNLTLDVRTVTVRAGKAPLKLTCNGDTACREQLKLTVRARVRRGRRTVTQTVNLGSVNVNIAAGRTATVNVTLTRAAKQLLARRNVRATVTGTSLRTTVTLKQPPARGRGRRGRGRRGRR